MQDLSKFIAHLRTYHDENEVIEFKEAKTSYDFDKIGKYVSALSNEANLQGKQVAWLLFGIKDKTKELVGSHYRSNTNTLMALKKEIADQTTGNFSFSQIHVTELESKRVILFEIPAAPKGIPIAWKGHYYGRDHESLGALHLDEIERIRNQVVQTDWSSGICESATHTDLDDEAVREARKHYLTKNPSQKEAIEQWDDATFLNKAKLTIKGAITRAAILLLGKPEAAHHIAPAVAQVTWLLKNSDGIEKDYEHFTTPLLLGIRGVYSKIRIIRYRYMLNDAIFPEEVDQYDPYTIREALNNAIAHQDYEKGGRVVVVENETGTLTFKNEGGFLPGSVESVIQADAPSTIYRNPFLVHAMVNLNLIDTIGSGIRKMFMLQRKKFFPLPDYKLDNESVTVTITGKVLDIKYATKLAQAPDLNLADIMLLDKIQKGRDLSSEELKSLREKKLVEGRKPNLHISATVAAKADLSVDYMKQRGIDNDYIKTVIVEALKKFERMKRQQFEEILMTKLSDGLTKRQKSDKIKNALQSLRQEGKITSKPDKSWSLLDE